MIKNLTVFRPQDSSSPYIETPVPALPQPTHPQPGGLVAFCRLCRFGAIGVLAATLCQAVFAQTITNGFDHTDVLLLGTTNSYTFYATNGDALLLRAGTATFRPLVTLHAPNGTVAGSSAGSGSSALDAALPLVIANTNGLFTVRASSYYGNGSGNFTVSLARIPAPYEIAPQDEGGPLTNGSAHAGSIAVGDLDVWSFAASQGDRLVLRIGATGFRPNLTLFSPSGAQLDVGAGAGSSDSDAVVDAQAPATGVYTVVAQAYYANGNGPYTLHLARLPGEFVVSPGDQGGTLVNGAPNLGEIVKGDLDLWRFEAAAGDSLLLRVGAPNFRPWIQLFSPTGVLIRESAGGGSADNDALITATATNSGVFTVLVQSYYPSQASSYTLNLAKIPGPFAFAPESGGGPLTNGFASRATNSLGDVDVWTFEGSAGDTVALRLGAPDYRPLITLYGPNGAAIQTASGGGSASRDATLFTVLTNTGVFTVAQTSFYYDGTGPYTLNFARMPGAYNVAPGDDGGVLTNGFSREGVIVLGDLDMWDFGACKGYPFSVVCEKTSGTMTLRVRLFARNGALLATAQSASIATINFRGTNSGHYTLLVEGAGVNDTGAYRLTAYGIQQDGLVLCPPLIANGLAEINGYGGTPSATFTLLSSTNLAQPVAEWPAILTNQFDSFGAWQHTNTLETTEPMRFYRLRAE